MAAAWPLLGRLAATHGTQASLDAFLRVWIGLLLLQPLQEWFSLSIASAVVASALLGVGIAGLLVLDAPLRSIHNVPADRVSITLLAAALAMLLWAAFALLDRVAIPFLILASGMFLVHRTSLRIPGLRATRSPYAAYFPWTTSAEPTHGGLRRWWVPATLGYALGTSALFTIWVIRFERSLDSVPSEAVWAFVYKVPNLFLDPVRTLVNFATGVWFNHHPVQLGYVLALLVLFGAAFERKEGSRRAAGVFYGASIVAGIVAGLLLHVLRALFDAAWIETAWSQPWTGGSAGAFGLVGAFAARAQKPGPLIAAVLFWELNVAFHLVAFLAAFLWVRYRMPERPAGGRSAGS
jgi:hypothetical protein